MTSKDLESDQPLMNLSVSKSHVLLFGWIGVVLVYVGFFLVCGMPMFLIGTYLHRDQVYRDQWEHAEQHFCTNASQSGLSINPSVMAVLPTGSVQVFYTYCGPIPDNDVNRQLIETWRDQFLLGSFMCYVHDDIWTYDRAMPPHPPIFWTGVVLFLIEIAYYVHCVVMIFHYLKNTITIREGKIWKAE